MQPYETQFHLSKDYLAESYDQSLPHGGHANPNFTFPAILFVAGAGLLIFTEQPGVAGWAFVALCILELLHIKFRRGWWLFRQTWGKNHNVEVTLTIDSERIQTRSSLAELTIPWQDVAHVIETDLGIILVTQANAQHYLSKSILNEDWLNWVRDNY
ncbi:MAG: YcxB family protein [Pseudomonadales bacterium]